MRITERGLDGFRSLFLTVRVVCRETSQPANVQSVDWYTNRTRFSYRSTVSAVRVALSAHLIGSTRRCRSSNEDSPALYGDHGRPPRRRGFSHTG
jgi:hypothetical protein